MKMKKKKSSRPPKSEGKWTQSQFVESLTRVMKKQEEENPRLKRVHAKMDAGWGEIISLVKDMMNTSDESREDELVEQIANRGKKALYPLIEFLLSFKRLGKKS